jgi:phosphate transport system substrate-binding protein
MRPMIPRISRPRRDRPAAAAALALAALLTACGRGGSVTLAGSTAFQPFAEKLADLYDERHPEANVTVQGGGSALGISAALNGAAQIGMADLVELPADAAALKRFAVARDGIAVVVNPANPVSDLPMARIRDIYRGAILNWKELGGPDAPITVVSRESGSGTRSSFESILGKLDLTVDAIIQDSNGTVRETVANDERAVGYLSYGLVSDKIKALTVDGVACRKDLIVAGEYRLVRPIYLLTLGSPSGQVGAFIDFVLSPEAQAILEADGLIPAAPARSGP